MLGVLESSVKPIANLLVKPKIVRLYIVFTHNLDIKMANINFSVLDKRNIEEVAALFTSVFTASEGQKEGELVGGLAAQLGASIDNHTIIAIGAYQEDAIVGAIFLTRLTFNQTSKVYMLAPVAISTSHQRQGIGQALINAGLETLKKRDVTVVVTYGDPAFYAKVGFQALSESVMQAPLTLSMPEGWLGQSLTGTPIPKMNGRPTCVAAFNDPVYW